MPGDQPQIRSSHHSGVRTFEGQRRAEQAMRGGRPDGGRGNLSDQFRRRSDTGRDAPEVRSLPSVPRSGNVVRLPRIPAPEPDPQPPAAAPPRRGQQEPEHHGRESQQHSAPAGRAQVPGSNPGVLAVPEAARHLPRWGTGLVPPTDKPPPEAADRAVARRHGPSPASADTDDPDVRDKLSEPTMSRLTSPRREPSGSADVGTEEGRSRWEPPPRPLAVAPVAGPPHWTTAEHGTDPGSEPERAGEDEQDALHGTPRALTAEAAAQPDPAAEVAVRRADEHDEVPSRPSRAALPDDAPHGDPLPGDPLTGPLQDLETDEGQEVSSSDAPNWLELMRRQARARREARSERATPGRTSGDEPPGIPRQTDRHRDRRGDRTPDERNPEHQSDALPDAPSRALPGGPPIAGPEHPDPWTQDTAAERPGRDRADRVLDDVAPDGGGEVGRRRRPQAVDPPEAPAGRRGFAAGSSAAPRSTLRSGTSPTGGASAEGPPAARVSPRDDEVRARGRARPVSPGAGNVSHGGDEPRPGDEPPRDRGHGSSEHGSSGHGSGGHGSSGYGSDDHGAGDADPDMSSHGADSPSGAGTADADGAGLSAARLSAAGLSAAGLSGAGLSGAGLSGAGLSGAGLSGAGLSGAGLSGAGAPDLEGRGAEGPDAEHVLTAVRELPGVRHAELVREPGRQQVLRLDLVASVDPQLVGRQAADLLRDQLGLHAAVRARSVQDDDLVPRSQRNHTSWAKPLAPFVGRPAPVVAVEQVQVVTAGLEAAVEVGLAVAGVRVAGRASGPSHDWHVLRAAVAAAIEALGMVLAGRARLALESAELVRTGPAEVAVVSLLVLSGAGTERVAGAAPVDGEAPDAAVRATVGAVRDLLPELLDDAAIGR